MTECNGSPCSIFFFDNIVIRGSEKVRYDVAVGDISVRGGDDMIVKDPEGNSLWREINATVINAGESPWSDLPVRFSVTNSQGDDMSDYLDYSDPSIWQLNGDSRYGDITAEGAEGQTELFVLFETPSSDAYHVMVETLAPYGKDFFPANNSKTVKFCIFSDGDDDDDDCVGNSYDECPDTLDGEEVDEYGCSYSQRDNDSDGIINGVDNCPETSDGEEVDDYGCSAFQRDTDNDGITDHIDNCPETPDGEEVDEYGCSDSQKDSDNDGITDDIDNCSDTLDGEEVDDSGCSDSQKDIDNDGIVGSMDSCPNTPEDEEVDEYGCSVSQQDTDGDGVMDDMDDCPETSDEEFAGGEDPIDEYGCSDSQKFANWYGETDWYLEDKGSACSGTDNNSAELCGNMFAEFCALEGSKGHSVCVLSDEICEGKGEERRMMSSAELDIWFCHGFNGNEAEEEEEEKKAEDGPVVDDLSEPDSLPSISLISVIGLLILATIIRRKV